MVPQPTRKASCAARRRTGVPISPGSRTPPAISCRCWRTEKQAMTQLDEKARARLPDSAFAYIDSRGSRRLPINDEAHVRNAFARFNQVRFENEAARDRARTRLVKAAKTYGIVPIG